MTQVTHKNGIHFGNWIVINWILPVDLRGRLRVCPRCEGFPRSWTLELRGVWSIWTHRIVGLSENWHMGYQLSQRWNTSIKLPKLQKTKILKALVYTGIYYGCFLTIQLWTSNNSYRQNFLFRDIINEYSKASHQWYLTLVVTSRWRQSSSSWCFKSMDSLVIV